MTLKVRITNTPTGIMHTDTERYPDVYTANIKKAEILLYDEIGYWGIDSKMFAGTLKEIGDVDHIVLGINSPGGDAFDGVAMFNALVSHPASVTVRVDSLAASAASLVAMAGDRIEMAENSTMMIHAPFTIAVGDAKELRKTADVLEGLTDQFISTYATRRGIPADKVAGVIWDETWLSAQEAVDIGFADEVLATPAIAASQIAQGRYRHTPAALLNSERVYTPPPPEWRVAASQRERDLTLAKQTTLSVVHTDNA